VTITEQERWRYARHLLLPDFGVAAQEKFKRAKVLVVGAGGLGSPALLYLAGAGVGRLGVADFDVVEESNLQRQVLHTTADIGRPKTESAAEKLRALNPLVEVVEHRERLVAANAFALIDSYDIIVNGVDNFPTRFLLNDACVMHRKLLVDGGVLQFIGYAMTIKGGETACYRCLFPAFIEPGAAQCATEDGVFGPGPGLIGTIQAMETLKLISGVGRPLFNRMIVFDALSMSFDEVVLTRDEACPVCGKHPAVTKLHDHEVHSATCRICMAGAIGRPAHWDATLVAKDDDGDA
jgi:molybdopterin/thiamine biosynthesis adenylyltransferase